MPVHEPPQYLSGSQGASDEPAGRAKRSVITCYIDDTVSTLSRDGHARRSTYVIRFKEDKHRLLSQPIAEKMEHRPMQDWLKQTRLHRDTKTAAFSRSCFPLLLMTLRRLSEGMIQRLISQNEHRGKRRNCFSLILRTTVYVARGSYKGKQTKNPQRQERRHVYYTGSRPNVTPRY